MSPIMRIPGPVGVGGTSRHFPRRPTGIEQIVAQPTYDLMIQQMAAQANYYLMIQHVEALATQATYDLLISAWAKHWNFYSDCLASCKWVARKVCIAEMISYDWHLVKMFKNDMKWCKGKEHFDAISRLNGGFRDRVIENQVTIHQGPLRGGKPEDTESFSLKPGMCLYTAEGWMKQYGKWRWAKRHMRMYIGKGKFRDNSIKIRGGGPVYPTSHPPTLYAVLGVWDPFINGRPF